VPGAAVDEPHYDLERNAVRVVLQDSAGHVPRSRLTQPARYGPTAPTMSTTKTSVSVPLMPARALPVFP
jgi:hypothetical protein